jgi:hypothetical protein
MLSGLFPTRDWPADHAAIFSRHAHYYGWGVAAGESLSEGQRKLLVALTAGGILAFGAVGLLLLKRFASRTLVVFATLNCLASVLVTGLVFRYWMPGLLCALVVVTVSVTSRWSTKSWLPVSALLALALVRTSRLDTADDWQKKARIAVGSSTYDAEYPDDPWLALFRYINAKTSSSAHVLAADMYDSAGVSSFGGFWSDRPFYATDTHAQAYLRFKTWPDFLASVTAAGITHVLIVDYHGGVPYNRRGYRFQEQGNEYPFCRRLVDAHGRKLRQFATMQLYEVNVKRAVEDERNEQVAAVAEPGLGK